jgi:cobyrinic acid a,c-diamide synthase
MTLIIAGERSGSGKTTVTLSLLAFLASKNYKTQSFKVGPDYIDPMFHTAITGLPCRNLDPILTSENYIQSCFSYHSQNAKYSLIEGVMGLFDGISFNNISNYASTAYLAKLLNLPVLLVIDCSKLSGSIAAIVRGYTSHDPQVKIIGLVLNKVGTDRHLELLKQALEPLNLPILGVLRRNQEINIPDRHLGLIPSEEITELKQIFNRLATLAETSFNWSQLLPYLETKKIPLTNNYLLSHLLNYLPKKKVKIAIARDKAFNFYYQDNLDILAQLGAELIFWSPLNDEKLPTDIQGIYLGGGFPEIFAEQLSQNQHTLYLLQKAIIQGTPTYAECGGLMYLSESIEDFDGKISKMAGILPTKTKMTAKLTLGYRQVVTLTDNPFSTQGTIIWGHEFHRSQMSNFPDNPLIAIKNCYNNQIESYQGWKKYKVYASYIHLHFAQCLNQVKGFLAQNQM